MRLIQSTTENTLVDLWGFTRRRSFAWFVIIITAALVFLEGCYNIDLLNALSDPNAVGSRASDLSQRGKLLAALGISWAVGRWLLSSIQPALIGLALLIGLSASTYYGLDYTYSKVIADLPAEVKVKGFNLFSYRHDLLAGTLVDPDIPLPKNEPVVGKIFMGAFPIVLLDERFMLPAQDIVARKAADKSNVVLSLAEQKWPEYDATMQRLTRSHAELVDASKKALGLTSIEQDWKIYSAKMQSLVQAHEQFIDGSRKAQGLSFPEREWNEYDASMQSVLTGYYKFVDGSRKAVRYGSQGTRKFREQSGGLDPNPNLTRTQFVQLLRASRLPEGERLRDSERRVVGQRPDGQAIYGRDIAYFMSRQEFGRWYAALAAQSLQAMGFEPNAQLTRVQFVDMLRKSKHSRGADLRKAENREIGKKADGTPLLGRDLPYFMSREGFLQWFAAQARDTIKANGFEPNPHLTRAEFVSTLRGASGVNGDELRQAELRVVGKRPDGSTLRAGDIPYFMSQGDYVNWFAAQAQEAILKAVPTTENVEKFDRIQEVNAAVFLPPMAIISSLSSALTNGISLIFLIIALICSQNSATAAAGELLRKLTVPLMLLTVAGLLIQMPSHVFKKDTPLYELETQLHNTVGLPGKVWSKLSNLQKFVL